MATEKTHKVVFRLARTGSAIFDTVLQATAEQICTEISGLKYQNQNDNIVISGDLDQENYEKYQAMMYPEKTNQ